MAVEINYLAVLVAAVASMVIGGLWYSVLFGKQWMKLMGFKAEDMSKMKTTAKQSYAIGFLSSLVMSYVLAHFVDYTGSMTVVAGLQLGFWVWLGFTATLQLGSVLWEGKSWRLFFLNTAHSLVSLLAMAVILAVWP